MLHNLESLARNAAEVATVANKIRGKVVSWEPDSALWPHLSLSPPLQSVCQTLSHCRGSFSAFTLHMCKSLHKAVHPEASVAVSMLGLVL